MVIVTSQVTIAIGLATSDGAMIAMPAAGLGSGSGPESSLVWKLPVLASALSSVLPTEK